MGHAYSVLAEEYFDGTERRTGGPYLIEVAAGRISRIARASPDRAVEGGVERAAFVMPGLVECHAHLFLDGGALDAAKRQAALNSPFETMMEVARRNAAAHWRHGVTLIRDAGDRFGVNHALRADLAGRDGAPTVRSAGQGLRRPDRYGAFIAQAVASDAELDAALDATTASADDIKIVLTGIIDFALGEALGEPQFDAPTLARIVERARQAGKPTFAHCSGVVGLDAAVEAGVGSIEHGYFMTERHLCAMAEKGIAWTPTLAPVAFQAARPDLAGWNDAVLSNIERILDSHRRQIRRAHGLGVALLAGSDAGSVGVGHGSGLIEEVEFIVGSGAPLAAALAAATSVPRRLWGAPSTDLKPGAKAEFIALRASPFNDMRALGDVLALFTERPLTSPSLRS